MKRTVLLAVWLASCCQAALAAESVRHEMKVELDPAQGELAVVDRMVLPETLRAGAVEFVLNAALTVSAADPAVTEVAAPGGAALAPGLRLARYRIDSAPADGRVTLAYAGRVHFGLSDQKEEYTRGFRDTEGFLGEEGVYLAGGGSWYPVFAGTYVEFALDVGQPATWRVIGQGEGTARNEAGRAVWRSQGRTEDIHLVGGPLVAYLEAAGAVEAEVYLHEPDDALAAQYLTATAQYIEMYRALIGPYPYGKFALVENFWETGFGMPSFTLLGPAVIRFPFILHSSYPHEILHNWWGNSVFVDYESGNWCEGLTAYLADHLIQEQRGKGAEYRRSTLQKYRDYVRAGRDFPLSEFRERHSAATEAVGYGKALMLFHMLRQRTGDEVFRQALARFYGAFREKRASFADLRTCFEEASRLDLAAFFEQWVGKSDAPSLSVTVEGVVPEGGGFRVRGVLLQSAPAEPFSLRVPLAVRTAAGGERAFVDLAGERADFEVRSAAPPILREVDPDFDLFRLLDPRETPPSLGQIFGEERILAVLPSAEADSAREQYRALVEGWRSDSHAIEVALDADLRALPAGRSIWILGRKNRFAEELFARDPQSGIALDEESVSFGAERAPLAAHSFLAVRRHPADPERALGWLVVDPEAAFPGLGRKLPHYGKYSYLAFEGGEPTNVVKGQWAALESPLRVDLRPVGERGAPLPPSEPEARPALAELPALFSQEDLRRHVERLAAGEMEGRGLGSDGLAVAADYVAEQFAAAGLEPGCAGGWFQEFTVEEGPDGQPCAARNVIGVLSGTRADWREQSVILSAHYDHLGRGWPEAREGEAGKIHPGADDNASGVAVLIELARHLAREARHARSVVFIAFSAEEAGRLGSKRFAADPGAFPREGMRGAINLDTVGRLSSGTLQVLGAGTADEWQHIFRGAGYVTGLECQIAPGAAEGSDQQSFIEQGIPAVQIFTGAHEDYHRPSDTPERVDAAGLVRVAAFVKEAVVYLAEREEPLTARVAGGGAAQAPQAPAAGRRILFGTVPDFAFAGEGVKVASLVADSPAARAGILAGDVLIELDGQKVANLQQFSGLLKALAPGQTVAVALLRDNARMTFDVTVEAR
ncbi:MAG: M20/M25/M40 family metallo-hydrolase [Planctomycetes bacterium]|nr:M20/M25/M40 family metallo-hydrolase [Planctomycetota bacterium]